jgi:L-rhamnose-H+ transport protein
MSGAFAGLAILVVAGIMNASFTLPMKFTRRWSWENTWLAWSLIALLVLPTVAAWATIPHLAEVYQSVAVSILVAVVFLGMGWGVAQLLFGLAVDWIGIALTFSLVLGTSAGAGALVPFIRLHPERLNTPAGYGVIAGVLLVFAGVLTCAYAGRQRERATQTSTGSRRNVTVGLALAIICGLAASLMNLGVVFGAPLSHAALQFGAKEFNASNVIWLPLLYGGAVPNILYCLWLLKKNGSTMKFGSGGVNHWALSGVMAIFWFGSTLLYGLSATQMGSLGPILGWPLFMSLIVIAASLLGMFTGEWKDSGAAPLRIQWIGVGLLIIAVFVLAGTSRYLS